MIERSEARFGARSVPCTNGSGSGRPKNILCTVPVPIFMLFPVFVLLFLLFSCLIHKIRPLISPGLQKKISMKWMGADLDLYPALKINSSVFFFFTPNDCIHSLAPNSVKNCFHYCIILIFWSYQTVAVYIGFFKIMLNFNTVTRIAIWNKDPKQ